ncbi:MAG: transposase [Acidobacteria bacterium]|nr:transposase [Acidobacteriota bacterium]
MKFPGFDSGSPRKFAADNFQYDAETDTHRCPAGHVMEFSEDRVKTTQNGRKQNVKIYRTEACGGCPMRAKCSRAGDGRSSATEVLPAQGARDAESGKASNGETRYEVGR